MVLHFLFIVVLGKYNGSLFSNSSSTGFKKLGFNGRKGKVSVTNKIGSVSDTDEMSGNGKVFGKFDTSLKHCLWDTF